MTSPRESLSVQRLEVVDTGRRRRWTLEEKLRIVQESYQGHRQVSATARRYNIPPSLLYTWRKACRQVSRGGDDASSLPSEGFGRQVGFVPAVVVPDEVGQPRRTAAGGRMEILTGTGYRIVVGPDVDAGALARVVAALASK